jgi:hypothetical protein
MPSIHQYALYLHVAVGSCALIIFWIPIFTRKGNLDHKRFGRYFACAMYTVSLSGISMASLDLLFPLKLHTPQENLTALEASQVASEVRNFALFLLSLSILVLCSTRQGWLAIKYKTERGILRAPLHLIVCSSLLIVGLTLLANGIRTGSVLYIIFSMLQIATAVGYLRYNFKRQLKPKEWWIQHLSGMISAGIGAYTAFFVFGGKRILEGLFGELYSDFSLLLWVAPGVIGGIAIQFLSQKYKQRFLWATQG